MLLIEDCHKNAKSETKYLWTLWHCSLVRPIVEDTPRSSDSRWILVTHDKAQQYLRCGGITPSFDCQPTVDRLSTDESTDSRPIVGRASVSRSSTDSRPTHCVGRLSVDSRPMPPIIHMIPDVYLDVLVGSWWSVGVVCFHFKSVLEKISRMATDRQQNTRTRGCTFCGKCVWYQNSWAW